MEMKEQFDTKIADNFRILRNLNNYTQHEQARLLHVSRSTLAQYESGRRIPDVSVLYGMAKANGITMEMLIENDMTHVAEKALKRANYSQNEYRLMSLYRHLTPAYRKRLITCAERMELEAATHLEE